MDQIASLGTDIATIIGPTTQVYGTLLSKNADAIISNNKTSATYGPHPRQELDVYHPKDTTNAPIIVFVHGGGLVHGDRTIPSEPTPGLVYANVGHYFTQLGYIVVVPSYRLVFQHDAAFPSGGEDIALVVKWIAANLGGEEAPRNLFIMGHSAGGLHAATYLLAPPFASDIAAVNGEAASPVQLRGFILLGTPLSFDESKPGREDMLNAYYGDHRDENSPLGLLKSYQKAHPTDFPLAGVQVLVIDAELDPEEIREPTTAFLGQWLQGNQIMKDHILYREIEGHNHISPPWALGTGIEKEEAWAEEVTGFVDSILRRDQVQMDLKILQDSIKKPRQKKEAPATAEPKVEATTRES